MNRLLLLFPLCLAACGSPDAKVVDANASSVSVRYDGSDAQLSDANKLARLACADHSRASALMTSSKTADGYIAAYDCRKAD